MPDILDHVYRTGEPFTTDEMLDPARPRLRRRDHRVLLQVQPGADAERGRRGLRADGRRGRHHAAGGGARSVEQAHAEREELLGDLAAASRAKDEFLAMLGHELRNPLAPILTALQLMTLRGIRGAEQERAIIERQVKHVVGLVDDLLDVSRITRGKIELKRERVRLADAVARAIEQASPLDRAAPAQPPCRRARRTCTSTATAAAWRRWWRTC